MISVYDVTKEGKGRHRRFYFDIYHDDSEDFISIRKAPRSGKVKVQVIVEDAIDPNILAAMFRVASITSTIICLHLDFVQIHKALQSIEGIEVNDIIFEPLEGE